MKFPYLLLPLLLAGCSDYEIIAWEGVDTFLQNPAESVDILLVIDNSGSMEPYQQKLSRNFENFLTYFLEADVDYHIATVTTDVMVDTAGQIVDGQVITPETPDAESIFQQIVNVGTEGSGIEMGMESAYLALTEPLVSTSNASFLREDASLSILFVSDEEDSSPRPVNDYINAFRDVKGQRARDVFNASALTVTDLATCTGMESQYSTVNTRYVDMAQQTDGVVGDICQDDFSDIVTELSLNASRLRDTFYLSDMPDPSTLRVWVDEEEIPCDAGVWVYTLLPDESGGSSAGDTGAAQEELPAIVFTEGNLPHASATIVVRYMYGGGDPADFCTEPTGDTGAAAER